MLNLIPKAPHPLIIDKYSVGVDYRDPTQPAVVIYELRRSEWVLVATLAAPEGVQVAIVTELIRRVNAIRALSKQLPPHCEYVIKDCLKHRTRRTCIPCAVRALVEIEW